MIAARATRHQAAPYGKSEANNKENRMSIERLRLANNGLIEVHSEGPMCWHDDYQELRRSMQDEMDRMAHRLIAISKGETVRVEYDLSPAMVDTAIKAKLIELGWTPPSKEVLEQPQE